MKSNQSVHIEDDFPPLFNPARRALAAAGYQRLAQLAEVSEAEISRLHGMGPSGIKQLREALAAKGLSFAEGKTATKKTNSTS